MKTKSTVTLGVGALLVGGAVLVAAGAGGMYLWLGFSGPPAGEPPHAAMAHPPAAAEEIAVTLTQEALTRAGIKTAKPTRGETRNGITVPGIVAPNAYRQVVVRSVAAGQVRTVSAELGAQIKRGDVLATIHTPELAETVRVYLSMQSELEAAHMRLDRLESLVKIGAASQQELEIGRAEHTRHATDVESARSKLILLGMTPTQVASLTESSAMDSLVQILAPSAGVISARAINPGTNIDASTDLFTIVDLDAVWVVANVYEQDLSHVHAGMPATVSTPSVSGRTWTGQVSYIDPQLAPETRAAKVRIEIDNPAKLLRLGMYVTVTLTGTTGDRVLLIPRTAVQTIGSQSVVYVSDPSRPGRFVERSVTVRSTANDQVEVVAGVGESDDVAVAGSFALRAERDRLGLPPPLAVPIR